MSHICHTKLTNFIHEQTVLIQIYCNDSFRMKQHCQKQSTARSTKLQYLAENQNDQPRLLAGSLSHGDSTTGPIKYKDGHQKRTTVAWDGQGTIRDETKSNIIKLTYLYPFPSCGAGSVRELVPFSSYHSFIVTHSTFNITMIALQSKCILPPCLPL